MAYDTLSPYAGAYPQTKEEIPTPEATAKAMRQGGRDLGVGSLRFGTFMAMAPEIDWLANKMAPNVGYPMMMADPAYQSFPQKEKEAFHKKWLAAQGERGDEQHHEWGKKQLNKYHGMDFWEWSEQIPELLDEIIPLETTEGSKAVENIEMLLTLGWGLAGIAQLLKLAATKGPAWLRKKLKSIVKNKQGEEILDDIVPEASLQIEHKPVPEARIDKTVERATAEKTPLQRSGDLMNQFLEEAGIASDIKISSTGSITTPKTKPKTKPKTGEEFDQKWLQKPKDLQKKYDRDVEAIYASAPAGKITPEKIERVDVLTKKLKKKIDKMMKEMDQDFAHIEEQDKIRYAADRKKIEEAKESILTGEIPEEMMEKLLNERLLKTDPKHFQEAKEYTAWKMDKNKAYTRNMLVDEADKLYKWYDEALQKVLDKSTKAAKEAFASSRAKIKKVKAEGRSSKEFKADLDEINDWFNAELEKNTSEHYLQSEKIHARYAKEKEKLEKASVLLEESLKKEQADLAAGKITRHSRGGLVENKVNYALNQWN